MALKPLSMEERLLSYSKYYYLPVDPPDPGALQILNQGPIDPSLALDIENINDLFQPGYLPAEFGYCVKPDGTGFIANYVKMPNVTPEMIDWWFVWHFISPPSVPKEAGNLRYKLWCPEEHWDTGAVDEAGRNLRCDNSKPLRGRATGVNDYIIETIDGERMYVEAHSVPLDMIGIKPEFSTAPDFGTAIAAVCDFGKVSSVNLHYFRPIRNGVELRTRLWYGHTIRDGKVVKNINPDVSTEEFLEILKDSYKHNMVECPHLAKLLPMLYAEEGWKNVDAY